MDNILSGRELIKNYRNLRRGNPKNSQILNDLITSLKKLGFDSLDDFYTKNKQFNIDTFGSIYKVEGNCSHQCHGLMRGCTEDWYKKRMKETNNESNGSLANLEESYKAFFTNKRMVPPACSYKIIKTGDTDINWKWM